MFFIPNIFFIYLLKLFFIFIKYFIKIDFYNLNKEIKIYKMSIIIYLLDEGLKPSKVSKTLGLTPQRVNYYVRLRKKELSLFKDMIDTEKEKS